METKEREEMSELTELTNAFIGFKATNEQKWKSHDERSDEIKKDIKSIFKMMTSLNCGTHIATIEGNEKRLDKIERALVST